MPYQMAPDEILLPAARNDTPSGKVYDGKRYIGRRDAMCNGPIRAADWPEPPVISDAQLARCCHFSISQEDYDLVQAADLAREEHYDANNRRIPTPIGLNRAALSRPLRRVDGSSVDDLEDDAATQRATLPVDLRGIRIPILDLTKVGFDPNAALTDRFVITSGNTNVGSGEVYTTWGGVGGFASDIGSMTGKITATQTSAITETSTAQYTHNLNGYEVEHTTNSQHLGDPTAGYLTSINHVGHAFRNEAEGPGTMTFGKFHTKRLLATVSGITHLLWITVSTNHTQKVCDWLMDGNNIGAYGMRALDNNVVAQVFNTVIWDATEHGLFWSQANASDTIENIIVYSCTLTGVNLQGLNVDIRNVGSYDNGTDYTLISAATGRYNRGSDASGADGNWNSGTGNTTGGVAATDFQSVDDTNSLFFDPTAGSAVDGGGEANALSRSVGIRGRAVPGPNGTSIGAAEIAAAGGLLPGLNPYLLGKSGFQSSLR